MTYVVQGVPLTIQIQEDGTTLGFATALNFTTNLTAAGAGYTKSVSASGGGGSGISGPGSSTDNAIPRWDGTGGATLQNSSVIISDAGDLGISTTSPAAKLHVRKGAGAGGDVADSNAIVQYDSDANTTNFWFNVPSAGINATMGFATAGGIRSGIIYSITNDFIAITNDASLSTPTTGLIVRGEKVGINTNAPTSRLHVNGSQAIKSTDTATNYTVLSDDYLIRVTSTAAARTITLPTAVGCAGRVYEIKDASGGAATNNITIDGDGSETIDGAANITIISNYGSARVMSNGTGWDILKSAGSGVIGPVGANNWELCAFDGTTGQVIKGADVYVDASGNLGVGTDNPNSRLMVTGSVSFNPTITATDYTATDADFVIYVTDTSSARTITLPSTGAHGGRMYYIADASGGAAANNITVVRAGSNTIQGATSYVIRSNYGGVLIQADAVGSNTNWAILAERNNGRYRGSDGGTVASANDLALAYADYANITGSTEIQRIDTTGWTAGTTQRVKFASTPTVKHNQAATLPNATILIDGGADYAPTAGCIAELFFDGTNFYLSPFYSV